MMINIRQSAQLLSKLAYGFAKQNYLVKGFPHQYDEQLIKQELQLSPDCTVYLIKKQLQHSQQFTGKFLVQCEDHMIRRLEGEKHRISQQKIEVHQIEEDIKMMVKQIYKKGEYEKQEEGDEGGEEKEQIWRMEFCQRMNRQGKTGWDRQVEYRDVLVKYI